MSYEQAPATKMLASHCAACGRPLVDASSVEAGLGPDCRKRLGFNQEVPPEARAEANRIVYQVAVDQVGADVVTACARLRELGFIALADRIADRVDAVVIRQDGDRLQVTCPFKVEALDDWRHLPGRYWDRSLNVNVVPASERCRLWDLLRRHFAGKMGLGPKGAFVIKPEEVRHDP